HAAIDTTQWTMNPLAPLAPDPATGRFILKPGDPQMAEITAFAATNRVYHLCERYAGLAPQWGPERRLAVRVRAEGTQAAWLNAFRQPTIRNAALAECKADLRKPNRIANIGEGAMKAILGRQPGRESADTIPVIRTALNHEVYDPAQSLWIEPHQGSLPLSGAV